jgi:hypothetical protein
MESINLQGRSAVSIQLSTRRHLVDAARGQALASRSSWHRVFRSRGPFEPGPGFVRNQDYPDLVAVTFSRNLSS